MGLAAQRRGTIAGGGGGAEITFGNTANGTNADNGWHGYSAMSPFTMPSNGTVVSIAAWATPVTSDQTFTGAIWADTAGLPAALLAQTATGAMSIPLAGGTAQSNYASLQTPLAVTAGQIIWVGWANNSAGDVNLLLITGGAGRGRAGASAPLNPMNGGFDAGKGIPVSFKYY